MTTCPSDVHYMHLVDHARKHIEETYTRPPADRLLRAALATVLPRPILFRLALLGAKAARRFAGLLPERGHAGRLRAMLGLAPARLPSPSPVDAPQVFAAEGTRRARVALLSGCAQQVLAPEINEATIRLLTRHGAEVVIARRAGCCGSLAHHLGKERPALRGARANIDAWSRELAGAGLDAVVVNASGCGTTVKDYGFMLREDAAYSDKAARISAITRDVTETMSDLGLGRAVVDTDLVVAYHSACSMQHGQGVTAEPKALLAQAGFTVRDVPEGHLCCGSAGTYNMLQPEIATRLRDRKVANIERVRPDVIATGNIGCIAQIVAGTSVPILHTVALLDWATGGPLPDAIATLALDRSSDKGH
jgi:glycolate oxidase iron-sulfur subunit